MGAGAGTAAIAAAGVGAAGSIASGVMSSSAAGQAASEQAASAQSAQALQAQMFGQEQANLQPYINTGQQNLNALSNYGASVAPGLMTAYNNAQSSIPGQITQANLENTPGYQFQLQQAQKATNASAAAKGLGVSGASLEAAAQYGQQLANSNYQTQFANQQNIYSDQSTQFNNALANANAGYNYLSGPATLGENAAGALAGQETQSASGQASSLQNAGNALASGTLGSQAGLNSAISGVGTSGTNALGLYNSLQTQSLLQNALASSPGVQSSYNAASSGYNTAVNGLPFSSQ